MCVFVLITRTRLSHGFLLNSIRLKMPEISQDAFEILNPGLIPITPTELRSRSNSLAKNPSSPTSVVVAGELTTTATTPSHLTVSENFRDRSATIGENDMDQSIINGLSALDVSHRYKRELDHR